MEYHLAPRWMVALNPRGATAVRLSEDLRRSTVFLGEDVTDESGEPAMRQPGATGFFVVWKSDSAFAFPPADNEVPGVYLVTARHVADKLGAYFLIRFNGKDGGPSKLQAIGMGKWHFHPDDSVDVAVMHRGYPDWADCSPIPGHFFVRPAEHMTSGDIVPNTRDIGIGDMAYVVGLFRVFFGKRRNLPLAYTGHVALLPEDERIPVMDRRSGRRFETEGYLVQAPAIDGASGAPVFARQSVPVHGSFRPEQEIEAPMRGESRPGRMHGRTVLLGLWSSSWEGEPSDTLMEAQPATRLGKVPVGFGIVAPAYKIAETLNIPELVAERRVEYQRAQAESATTTDTG